MSLLLLLYGTGEEASGPIPPEEDLEQPILFGGMYLRAPKPKPIRRKKYDQRYEAARNYQNRLLRDDEELILILSVMT